jgi:hypothetical protein
MEESRTSPRLVIGQRQQSMAECKAKELTLAANESSHSVGEISADKSAAAAAIRLRH